ncbi:hypothetical protein LEMLEM_LOCUS22666 [Lemmus lemmus]
MMLNSER